MPEDLRRTPPGRLDSAIDTVLGEMVREEPPAALRPAVMSRLDETAGVGHRQVPGLAGWWRRFVPVAGLAAAGAAALVVYLAWPTPAPVPTRSTNAPVASRARAAEAAKDPAALAASDAAGATAEGRSGSVESGGAAALRSTRTARVHLGAADAREPLADVASTDAAGTGTVGGLSAMIVDPDEEEAVSRLVVSALPAPAAITIAPVAFHDLVIDQLRIPLIEVAPLDPGGQSSTTREPSRRERQ